MPLFREKVLKFMHSKQKSRDKKKESFTRSTSAINIPEIQLHIESRNTTVQIVNGSRNPEDSEISNEILDVLLNDILYGYETLYEREDYWLLLDRIYQLVSEKRVMKFFLPAFPAKSSNKYQKVLGINIDFAESIAIDNLIKITRKIESIYKPGALVIIMSDYHTFDQYIQVEEENYNIYHQGLKDMIKAKGAEKIIQLISLSYFEQFEDVPEQKISSTLAEKYGGNTFRASFSEEMKKSPVLLKKYTQQKKFFSIDLSYLLRRSPNSKRKQILKETATGMISQGVALDKFLKEQRNIDHYVRLSIHQHHPESGKFAVDLFKNKCKWFGGAQLRTPWHNTVLFNSFSGRYCVDFKETNSQSKMEDNICVLVHFNDKPYFYVKLFLTKPIDKESFQPKITMTKHSCGIVIEVPEEKEHSHNIFSKETVLSLVKEFGVVVFRGFQNFENEDDFLNHYEVHMKQKSLNWDFGPIHKVMPSSQMPGYVNSQEGIPVHWDMVAPPKYMGIDQEKHEYEDFICPMFALYCRNIDRPEDSQDSEILKKSALVDTQSKEGATTFIDTVGLVQMLPGSTLNKWKQIKLEYETQLVKKDENGKEVYFGGDSYTYPLIRECPGKPGLDVLRWWQNWPKKEFPNAKQHNHYKIVSDPSILDDTQMTSSVEELEKEIRKAAFDERNFFWHQYQKGDLVYVNNNTTLHGRYSFEHPNRELWRIQSLPSTDNLPDYFKK